MPDASTEEKNGRPSVGFLSRFVGIFVSPKRVFLDVDRGTPWWEPWVWVSLVNMVVAYVVLPIQIHLYRLREGSVPEEQFERTLESMQSFPIKYLGIISAPLTVLLVALIFSGVSYIVVSVLSERASFKKHMTIYLYASIVASVGLLISNIVVRGKGVENIRSLNDAVASFGPAAFLVEGHRIWYAVLSTLDVFYLWSYVLVAVGVMHVFRLSGPSAVLVVVPIWLLSILVSLLGAQFGGAF